MLRAWKWRCLPTFELRRSWGPLGVSEPVWCRPQWSVQPQKLGQGRGQWKGLEWWTNWHLCRLRVQFSSTQSLSCVRLFATPWIAARKASLFITISQSSLKLTSIESVMPFSHLILDCPLLLQPQSLPASESFPISQLFAWGGQSTGASALASFLPKKSQGWSLSEWTGWISLQSKGL